MAPVLTFVMRFFGGDRYDAWRHRRMMKKARPYRVVDMPENTFGRLVGTARPAGKRLLEAPLSGRHCVYYDATVDLLHGETFRRTLGSEQQGIDFAIADETGEARVDPNDAFVSAGFDYRESTSTIALDARQRGLLTRLGIDRLSWDGNMLQFREAVIEVDERISVFGGGVRELDSAAAAGMYRDGEATRLCLTGTVQFPLFISDDPKAL